MALTNGRQLYAMRRGSPLCIVQRDRLARRGSAPGSAAASTNSDAPLSARYVIVASCDGERLSMGYRALAEGEVVAVDRDLNVSSHKL